ATWHHTPAGQAAATWHHTPAGQAAATWHHTPAGSARSVLLVSPPEQCRAWVETKQYAASHFGNAVEFDDGVVAGGVHGRRCVTRSKGSANRFGVGWVG
ncbi:MAG: hypothetical protein ACI8XD_000733, partial [Thermoproteota archaeon]